MATEDVVYMLQGLNVKTGINLDKLVDVGFFCSDPAFCVRVELTRALHSPQVGEEISNLLVRKNNSRAANAILGRRKRESKPASSSKSS